MPYIHTATGLVERGLRTLKDLLKTIFEDKRTVSGALSRSLLVMRTMVHSTIKETPFERHYGRKPRTEITSYLNLATGINEIVSARPETLQVYSFNNRDGEYDQLIMKAPRKLKYDNPLLRRGKIDEDRTKNLQHKPHRRSKRTRKKTNRRKQREQKDKSQAPSTHRLIH